MNSGDVQKKECLSMHRSSASLSIGYRVDEVTMFREAPVTEQLQQAE
jgi:hypothetical protein